MYIDFLNKVKSEFGNRFIDFSNKFCGQINK